MHLLYVCMYVDVRSKYKTYSSGPQRQTTTAMLNLKEGCRMNILSLVNVDTVIQYVVWI